MISTPKQSPYSCVGKYRYRIREACARLPLNRKPITVNTVRRKRIRERFLLHEERKRDHSLHDRNRSLNLSVWRKKWEEMTPVPVAAARNLKTATGNKKQLKSFKQGAIISLFFLLNPKKSSILV
jgi:hypothetical protein